MPNAILASKLQAGDTIGIVSPSSPVTKDLQPQLEKGIAILESLGFRTKLAANALSNSLGYSASPQEKADDINQMFADSSVQAIFCSQGGQNANSVLPLLDYESITNNPKIFLGISDISVLLDGIFARTGLITFHGSDVLWGLGRNPDPHEVEELKHILLEGRTGTVAKNSTWRTIRGVGTVEGTLLGGNLSCLGKIIGTSYVPDFNGSILFLEEYGEDTTAEKASYALHHMDQAGMLKGIKGLLLGYYKTAKDIKLEDIAKEVVAKYDFPILQCDDFGHNTSNTILPIGVHAKLELDRGELSFLETYVQ